MRTAEERIKRLHRRTAELEKQRDRRQLWGLGGTSVFFAVILAVVFTQIEDPFHGITGGRYAGSSLLSESAGAFVIVALAAFFIGVILTAVLVRYNKKK